MATEGVENFQAIVVSLAAIAGSSIAAMGLWTWKQQIRWQQGRGLAVNILQAFFVFRRTALDVTKTSFFPLDDTQTEEQLAALSIDAWTRAKEYCAKLGSGLVLVS